MLRVKDDVVGLLNALKHQQASVRLHAVKALMQEELEPELAMRRFTAALADGEPSIRLAAIQAMGRVGDLAIPTLIKALDHPDKLMRREAAHALGRLGSRAAPAVLPLTNALKDSDRWVVQEAAKALGEIGPEARVAIPALIELLADTHFLACRLASWALVRIGPAAVLALIDAVEDADPYVRSEAVWALAHLGPAANTALPALLKLLRSEESRAMWKVERARPADDGLEATAPCFIPVRRNRQHHFWIWVIRAIGNLGSAARDAVPDLLRILRQGTGTFQVVAMQALRRIEPLTETRVG